MARRSTEPLLWLLFSAGGVLAALLRAPRAEEPTARRTLTVERVLADGFETIEAQRPCVVTVSNELGDPRYPQLRQIMAAARKQVQVWTLADLGLTADQLNRRITIERLYVPVKQSNVEIIEGDSPEEQAANLARRLREARII